MVMPIYSFGMTGTYGNMYQNFRARYSCGHMDSPNARSVPARYPGEITLETPKPELPKNKFLRLLAKLYS